MKNNLPLNVDTLISHLTSLEFIGSDEAQRIFHGRGHAFLDLHHITIDWLKPVILITLFAPVDNEDLKLLTKKLLEKHPECKHIQVQHRYKASWIVESLHGDPLKHLTIVENQLKYKLEIKSGANTGLFLDMRNGREWIKNNSKKKRVLNLFSYTCGFSIAAAAGEAKSVFNIDMSSPFLNTGRENHRLNNHDLSTIKFDKLNILKSFGRIKKHGPYDLIICDPPTFQKGSIDLAKDYSKLIRRFIDFMDKGCILFLCINTPHIGDKTGKAFLLETVKENAPDLVLIDEIKPPSIYKETQGKGTKVLVFK